MNKILIIGAGLSTSSLVKYLLEQCVLKNWSLTLADRDIKAAEDKIKSHEKGSAVCLDISNEAERRNLIDSHDLVVSMLPAFLHTIVAKDCVQLSTHLVTASYLSDEIKKMAADAENNGIVMMNEIGLDPGLDHMSAMKLINELKDQEADILSFMSFAGGLVAPEYDNNPWNYKFTWNPRNVVLAGQGVSKFIRNGQYKYIPYHQVFKRVDTFDILNQGLFEAYPNRDSLKYREVYDLEGIRTIYRGTLRRVGFSEAWNMFVQLGLTDDSYVIENSAKMTYRQFLESFLFYRMTDTIELKLAYYLGINVDSSNMLKLRWLGLFDDKKIGLKKATPAQILQKILEDKLSLDPGDKDMIVMHHIFDYVLNGKSHRTKSSLVVKGDDPEYTAMAKTVGYPLGVFVKLFMDGDIKIKGVHLPVIKEIYEPVLKELRSFDINFIEQTEDLNEVN
jgi:saccharopine dehydrogenase-like NADP-dependent oxidoreductase